jgi:hypothetical protein
MLLTGSFIKTKIIENINPKKVNIITIKLLLGALLSKGIVTGLIVVNTGVSLLT